MPGNIKSRGKTLLPVAAAAAAAPAPADAAPTAEDDDASCSGLASLSDAPGTGRLPHVHQPPNRQPAPAAAAAVVVDVA